MSAAIRASLGLCALLLGVIWLEKELPGLYMHEPWQDDPYDAMVSFAFVAIPLLLVLVVLRVQLCRRLAPLPVRRLADLLQLCRALVGTVAVTLGFEWTSLVVRIHPSVWTNVTAWLVGALVVATMMTAAVVGMLREATRTLRRPGPLPRQPDWLADAITLGEREAARLGPLTHHAERAVTWFAEHPVAYIRRHPLRSVAVLSILVAMVAGDPAGDPRALLDRPRGLRRHRVRL